MTTSTSRDVDVFEIKAGPSAGEVWDAAKYAYTFSNGFPVFFSGKLVRRNFTLTRDLEMQIIGVRHEDGSGHSFMITARILGRNTDPELQGLKTFYYNAQKRTGHIDLKK